MSPLWLAAAAVLASIVFSFAYRAFRCRVRRGRFAPGDDQGSPSFVTDHGTFVVNRRTRTLDIVLPIGSFHLPFDDIESLQLEHRVREAMGEELLFEGLSLTDLHRKYRDHVHEYRIVLRTRTRGEVPLYESAQYEVRDFLDFATPLQLWLLGLVGLHRKAGAVADDVLGKIQQQLARAGVVVRAGRW